MQDVIVYNKTQLQTTECHFKVLKILKTGRLAWDISKKHRMGTYLIDVT